MDVHTFQRNISPLSTKKTIVFSQTHLFCQGLSVYLYENVHHSQAQLLLLMKNSGFERDYLHFWIEKMHHSRTKLMFSIKNIGFVRDCLHFSIENAHHSQAQLLFSCKSICFVKDCPHFSMEIAPLSIKTIVFTEKQMFCKGLSAFSMKNCTTLS